MCFAREQKISRTFRISGTLIVKLVNQSNDVNTPCTVLYLGFLYQGICRLSKANKPHSANQMATFFGIGSLLGLESRWIRTRDFKVTVCRASIKQSCRNINSLNRYFPKMRRRSQLKAVTLGHSYLSSLTFQKP
jgi:hypothetical protein